MISFSENLLRNDDDDDDDDLISETSPDSIL